MLYAIGVMVAIIIDQAVKYWVTYNVGAADTVNLLPGILSIVNVQNDGAAFSFLSGGGARIYFIILTGVFTLAVIIMLASNFISGRFGRWCMVMIMAGGLSNCIDRILYGYVVDMFKVELFNFAVFNVADIFITVFCILFILYILFGGEKNLEDDDEDDEDDDEYEEDEDEEDDERPSLLNRTRGRVNSRSARRDDEREYEDEYERYKAERNARQAVREERRPQPRRQPEPEYREQSVPQRQSVPQPARSADNDPFAEWERANARAESRLQKNPSYAQQAMGTKPAPSGYSAAREQSGTPAAPAVRPEPRYSAPAARPAPKAPEKPAPKAGGDEFSLDDILNEFR